MLSEQERGLKMDRPSIEIDRRLVEIARHAAPLGPAASPRFAEELLRKLATIGLTAEFPVAVKEAHRRAWLRLGPITPKERYDCRIERQDDRRVVTVPGRLSVRLLLGEEPRVEGVMVSAPWRDDALHPLSTACVLDGAAAEYEWRFARGGREYAVRARGQEATCVARVERVLSPIDVGVVAEHRMSEVADTPARAFDLIVRSTAKAAMPPPRHATGEHPRHGLGDA
jgi:hypothetical protein